MRQSMLHIMGRYTYADVPEKISTSLPSVINQRQAENMAVNSPTSPSRFEIPPTIYKIVMAKTGSKHANTVPKSPANLTILESE
jgi:hypothetical protein